ncbi:hypothetical protein [Mesorhizobium sophorae]|uniref:hypothetical protein n=1 Tax=Mesorhizobium sophorae TaxID=1300294 RepID=UPI001180053F
MTNWSAVSVPLPPSAAKIALSTWMVSATTEKSVMWSTLVEALSAVVKTSAAGGSIHFATLAANLALTNADFVVI